MTLNLADYGIDAVDSGEIRAERIAKSAFLRAGREIPLPLTGTVIRTISNIKAFGVGEGKAKTASGTNSSFKILPNKSVTAQVLTDEALKFDSNVANVIYEQQPSAHAKAVDAWISGLEAVPADFVGFGTLAAAQEVEVGAGLAAQADLDEAEALVAENGITAYVGTSTMLSYLRRQTVPATGNRVVEVLAAPAGSDFDALVNGTPWYTIKSPVAVAFAGDFSKLNYGEVALTQEEANQVKNQGEITDSTGQKHNLTSENKTVFINEAFYGVGVEGIANFVKLVPAPAA